MRSRRVAFYPLNISIHRTLIALVMHVLYELKPIQERDYVLLTIKMHFVDKIQIFHLLY